MPKIAPHASRKALAKFKGLVISISTRPLVRRIATGIGVLAAVNVALWLIRGKEALYRDTPAMARMGMESVSYTHLTLPTILRV